MYCLRLWMRLAQCNCIKRPDMLWNAFFQKYEENMRKAMFSIENPIEKIVIFGSNLTAWFLYVL